MSTTQATLSEAKREVTDGSGGDTADSETVVNDVVLDDVENLPTMYWGVASGGSIKALRVAAQSTTVEDHGWTIDGGGAPNPGFAEMSYTTANANQLFEGVSWFIDCGGFTELVDNGRYDYPIEEYVEYLAGHINDGIDIQYYALRDWPITREILREYDRSERTHQRWSVRDHVKTLELAEEYGLTAKTGCKPMAVVQGVDTAGYLWHLDYLAEHGLLTEHVCLGSLKSLSASEVRDVAEAVRATLPANHTLHGLGLTYQHLQYAGVRSAFDTIDTQSWNKARSRLSDDFDAVRNTWIGYLRAYQHYAEKLAEQPTEMQNGSGTRLFDFGGGQAAVSGHYDTPIRECVCGTVFDPNAIKDAYDAKTTTENTTEMDALDMAGCRHCRRSMMNIVGQIVTGDGPHALESE